MWRLRRRHGAVQLNRGPRAVRSRLCRGLANALTLARFAAPAPFVYLMVRTRRQAPGCPGAALFALYLLTASSDLLDGWLARRAGAPNARWGRLDALADMLFTTTALLAAAWLGLVGFWLPLGIAALAAQFLHRNRAPRAAAGAPLREDLPGKAAGVLYYLMAGAVALAVWLDPNPAPAWLAWSGNAVFAYTALVFMRNLRRTRDADLAPRAPAARRRG